MSKFIRNGLLGSALWLNVAAAMYYMMFEMVPISAWWYANIAGLKAGWPYLPLLVVAPVSMLIRNRFVMITITIMSACYVAAVYFVALANIAMFKILLQHTTMTHLALGIAWASVACVLASIPSIPGNIPYIRFIFKRRRLPSPIW